MNEPNIPYPVILQAVVGSIAHGVNVDDGVDDRDEMGVCIESPKAALGIEMPFEQYIYRSAAEREGRADAKSKAGDLDLTVFSLRKYLRLALKGNPTVILPLFAKPLICDDTGKELIALTPYIISRKAGSAYLG